MASLIGSGARIKRASGLRRLQSKSGSKWQRAGIHRCIQACEPWDLHLARRKM